MDYLKLKGVTDVNQSLLSNELQDNVVEFLDWGFLNIGNYYNVTLGETDNNGNDMSELKPVRKDPNYEKGQAWQGFRSNWVWQSGIDYTPAPLVGSDDANPGVSGVYVDSTFYPSNTTGTYAHKVDHFNGTIIFNNPIPQNSTVQAEYSYKNINVVYSANLPWLRQVQKRTYAVPGGFSQVDKGPYELPPQMRLQLPAIAVEVVPRRRYKGYQLGGGQFTYTDILFHCIAEDEYTVNQMIDTVSFQNDKTIFMFDSNWVASSGAFPLDYMGIPVASAKRYPELIQEFSTKRLRFQNSLVSEVEMLNSDLHGGVVRMTAEIIKDNI